MPLAPLPPSAYPPPPPGERSESGGNPELVPTVQRSKVPAQPRERKPEPVAVPETPVSPSSPRRRPRPFLPARPVGTVSPSSSTLILVLLERQQKHGQSHPGGLLQRDPRQRLPLRYPKTHQAIQDAIVPTRFTPIMCGCLNSMGNW